MDKISKFDLNNNSALQSTINDITNNMTTLANRIMTSDDIIKKNRNDLDEFIALSLLAGNTTSMSIDKINKRLEVIDDEILQLNKEYANIKAIGIFLAVILIAILIMLGLALFLKF